MARCWTCGRPVSGYHYRCSSCRNLRELESIHNIISEGFKDLARIQEYVFNQLSDQLSEIASVVEWGFGELIWQLQQQTDVLRSIDHTLKTPSETKANEWRVHAEELRRRGVLEESEEFFLKALNEYRLDYRIYVGLAETYLRMNRFDKARVFLEKSLPHAPKKEIDYRSYSYRLIGHIYACEENFNQAAANLQNSIKLSPDYADGHYDYAQYCAQLGDKESCLFSLQKAILIKPLYWYLAQKEQNFAPVRSEVEKLLSGIMTEALDKAKNAVGKAEETLEEATVAVLKVKDAKRRLRSKTLREVREEDESLRRVVKEIEEGIKGRRDVFPDLKEARLQNFIKLGYVLSNALLEAADKKLRVAKDKIASGDYVEFLKAVSIVKESQALANKSVEMADRELEFYRVEKIEERKKLIEDLPWIIIGGITIFAIIFAIIGVFLGVIGWMIAHKVGAFAGIMIALILAVLFVIRIVKGPSD